MAKLFQICVSFIQWILAACTNAIINISVYCLYSWYNWATLGIKCNKSSVTTPKKNFSWESEKMNVKFHKNWKHRYITENFICKMQFWEIGYSFSWAPVWNILWCYYRWLITSLALKKCIKECNNALRYSGIKFFPGGFHLNLLSNCLKTRQGNVLRSV